MLTVPYDLAIKNAYSAAVPWCARSPAARLASASKPQTERVRRYERQCSCCLARRLDGHNHRAYHDHREACGG